MEYLARLLIGQFPSLAARVVVTSMPFVRAKGMRETQERARAGTASLPGASGHARPPAGTASHDGTATRDADAARLVGAAVPVVPVVAGRGGAGDGGAEWAEPRPGLHGLGASVATLGDDDQFEREVGSESEWC